MSNENLTLTITLSSLSLDSQLVYLSNGSNALNRWIRASGKVGSNTESCSYEAQGTVELVESVDSKFNCTKERIQQGFFNVTKHTMSLGVSAAVFDRLANEIDNPEVMSITLFFFAEKGDFEEDALKVNCKLIFDRLVIHHEKGMKSQDNDIEEYRDIDEEKLYGLTRELAVITEQVASIHSEIDEIKASYVSQADCIAALSDFGERIASIESKRMHDIGYFVAGIILGAACSYFFR